MQRAASASLTHAVRWLRWVKTALRGSDILGGAAHRGARAKQRTKKKYGGIPREVYFVFHGNVAALLGPESGYYLTSKTIWANFYVTRWTSKRSFASECSRSEQQVIQTIRGNARNIHKSIMLSFIPTHAAQSNLNSISSSSDRDNVNSDDLLLK